MKKEDILKKSRLSNEDEGMIHAESQGHKSGFVAFAILFSILAILSLFFWQIATLHAISSLFWVYFCAEAYAKFRFTKKTRYLVIVICGSIAAIYAIINFILILIG